MFIGKTTSPNKRKLVKQKLIVVYEVNSDYDIITRVFFFFYYCVIFFFFTSVKRQRHPSLHLHEVCTKGKICRTKTEKLCILWTNKWKLNKLTIIYSNR